MLNKKGKGVKMRVYFMVSLLVIVLISITYLIYERPSPKYKTQNPEVPDKFALTQIAEGKRIARTICIRCHYNYETNTLAGRHHGNPQRLGEFSSGNITQDSVTGIGAWSNSALYYFLKTGVKPDGEYVFDMPKYPNLSEEDMLSILAFLKSDDSLVRKTYNPNPKPQYSFLTKLLLQTFLRPTVFENKRVFPPDTDNSLAFGKYLCTAKFSCYECHSLNMVTTNYTYPEKSWGFFRGGNPHVNEEREKIYTPNITGDSINGIGKWTEAAFISTVKNGIKPDGKSVRDPMFPFYLLSDREVKDIYAYLKTIK